MNDAPGWVGALLGVIVIWAAILWLALQLAEWLGPIVLH